MIEEIKFAPTPIRKITHPLIIKTDVIPHASTQYPEATIPSIDGKVLKLKMREKARPNQVGAQLLYNKGEKSSAGNGIGYASCKC